MVEIRVVKHNEQPRSKSAPWSVHNLGRLDFVGAAFFAYRVHAARYGTTRGEHSARMGRGWDYCASCAIGLLLDWFHRMGAICDQKAETGADFPMDFLQQPYLSRDVAVSRPLLFTCAQLLSW